ncbi:MAG TPA: erythromycin esterase family protein [Polyangiaceae bacterium LLY-WYZ-14_1]|nr:erythromycin esterase family protein [Polyangiaceae bacterium LLY-WYZ-14_1]
MARTPLVKRAHALPPGDADGRGAALEPILERVGDASLVLLGEASHGTDEFYRTRGTLTRRLIDERGFDAVVAEADWPDAWRVHRFATDADAADATAEAALGDFRRFPRWMWRNEAVRSFLEELRTLNAARPASARAGFFGMDLYGMHASMEKVLAYLEEVDPEAAARARARYDCIDDVGPEPQRYGYLAGLGLTPGCEEEVLAQLVELREVAAREVQTDGLRAEDERFFVEQNARAVASAERYYRAMFERGVSTWNLRDVHMAETVQAIRSHLSRRNSRPAKLVVWAHNSHLGDARFTERRAFGEVNVGQLLREEAGRDSVIVGFTTHRGSVSAASGWDRPVRRRRVRPSLEGSWEHLLHEVGLPRFALVMGPEEAEALPGERLNRAIGVIYRPETERASHYFHSELPRQFDVVIHEDETQAVAPLDPPRGWLAEDELPETYPHGV